MTGEQTPVGWTDAQRKQAFALARDLGLDRQDRHDLTGYLLDRDGP